MNKFAIGCGGVLVILVFIVVVLGLALMGSYNRLVRSQQAVDSQWAQVQNVYQRRADLIPNLVNTVQGAANFEKSTLTDITNARASVGRVQIDPNKAPTDPKQLEEFQRRDVWFRATALLHRGTGCRKSAGGEFQFRFARTGGIPRCDRGRNTITLSVFSGVKRIALCLATFVAVHSYAAEVIPPRPAGYFNDYAGVVSSSAALRFNAQLAPIARETSKQVGVGVFR